MCPYINVGILLIKVSWLVLQQTIRLHALQIFCNLLFKLLKMLIYTIHVKFNRKSHKFIKAKCQEIIKVQWKSHSMDAKFDVSCKFLLFSSVKVIAIYCFLWFCWIPYIIKMTTHQNKYGYKTINLLSQFWVHPLHLLFYRFLLLIIDLCFSEKICKK